MFLIWILWNVWRSYRKTRTLLRLQTTPNRAKKSQLNMCRTNGTCRCLPVNKSYFEEIIEFRSVVHLLTGVTLMRATEKETRIAPKVNNSLENFFPLKNVQNSSIKPVITHSKPPIYKKNNLLFNNKKNLLLIFII